MLDADHAPTLEQMFYSGNVRPSRRYIDSGRALLEHLSSRVHSPYTNGKRESVTHVQPLSHACSLRKGKAKAVMHVQPIFYGCVCYECVFYFPCTFHLYTIPPVSLCSIQRNISSAEKVGEFFVGVPLGQANAHGNFQFRSSDHDRFIAYSLPHSFGHL
jgi:hypothetical protein